MSQYEDIMERLDWCVAALKHLLANEAGWQVDSSLEGFEDLDLEDEPPPPNEPPLRVVAAKETPCQRRGHIHQRLDQSTGAVVCADCGVQLIDTKADHFSNASKG